MRVNKKTIIFICFLTFLLIILVVLKILQGKNQSIIQPLSEKPTPTLILLSPTYIIPSPTSIPECSPNKEVLNKLPVVTEKYTIEYLPVPEKYFVMILGKPFEKYKAEAEKWFTIYGTDPRGPCVFWASPKTP